MKVGFVRVSVMAVGLLTLAVPETYAQGRAGSGFLFEGREGLLTVTREWTWSQGRPAVRMIRARQGFCYLTAIRGRFEGGAEQVAITIADGFWTLRGTSMQADVSASARCVRVVF